MDFIDVYCTPLGRANIYGYDFAVQESGGQVLRSVCFALAGFSEKNAYSGRFVAVVAHEDRLKRIGNLLGDAAGGLDAWLDIVRRFYFG